MIKLEIKKAGKVKVRNDRRPNNGIWKFSENNHGVWFFGKNVENPGIFNKNHGILNSDVPDPGSGSGRIRLFVLRTGSGRNLILKKDPDPDLFN